MLRIRLRRNNKSGDPFFQVIVVDSRRKRDGIFIEKLGFYKPKSNILPKCSLNIDRIIHWISHGAQPSTRVQKLIESFKKNQSNQQLEQES